MDGWTATSALHVGLFGVVVYVSENPPVYWTRLPLTFDDILDDKRPDDQDTRCFGERSLLSRLHVPITVQTGRLPQKSLC